MKERELFFNVGQKTMSDSRSPSPLFNQYASSYDEVLKRGLCVTGESAEYYLKYRIRLLLRRLAALKIDIGSFLDFGCGIGNAIPVLKNEFPQARLVGVDLSSYSIGIARERYLPLGVEFCTIEDFQPEESFDAVYCNGVFHHVLPKDRLEVMSLIRQSLRHGGVFCFCDNNPWNPGTRYITNKTEFDREAVLVSPREAKRLLHESGFTLRTADYVFIFPRMLSWFRPLEPLVQSLPLGGQYVFIAEKT